MLKRNAALVSSLVLAFVMVSTTSMWALNCKTDPGASNPKKVRLEGSTFEDFGHDQACIWTSPVHLKDNRNWTLFLPWAGTAAMFMTTDHEIMRDYHPSVSRVNTTRHISDAGLYGLVGAGGAMYLVGAFTKNQHARETGWLAGEAVVDGLVVNLTAQRIARRARPDAATHPGDWFVGGAAFPSDHAMASWSIATVIAHEYSGWATKWLAYGTAAGASAARVLAEKHSPSDVVIGSTIGFLIGNYVYHAHQPVDAVPVFGAASNPLNAFKLKAARSPYLPLDSHYYEIFDRLIAMGYIDSAITGLRPWTRWECARLVNEADRKITHEAPESAIESLQLLKDEFGMNSESLPTVTNPVESAYGRVTAISGEPLRDGYHFGQTIADDFGRPYWTGGNAYLGGSGATSMGPITFYGRGEYQYAPGGLTYATSTQNFIKAIDGTPQPILPDGNDVSRFSLIEGYGAVALKNVEVSVGKQALWWGTAQDTAMLYSDNAESIYSLRLSMITPKVLPSFLKYLGPMRLDGYFGKFGGHLYPKAPWTHGLKLSMKPTENLEFGFARTVVFAGDGHPLTLKSFAKSFFSVGDNPNAIPGSSNDVGDRKGGFDVSYRVPKLRKWLTIYSDMFTDDDPSPLSAPQRSAFDPGIYLTHFPKLSKLDLRIEAPTSALSEIAVRHGRFFYFNDAYRDGYTNYGNIVGSWVGRQAKAVEATSNYWFSPTNVLQVSYRHATIDPSFVIHGGNYTDGKISYQRDFHKDLTASAWVQVERWNIPMIKTGVQNDTTMTVQLTWHPK